MLIRLSQDLASAGPRSRALVLAAGAFSALILTVALVATSAAQAPTAFTGRVVWCVATPYPMMAPDAGGVGGVAMESLPPAAELIQPVPPDTTLPVRPDILPRWRIPAGAVLVAVQGTSLMTKTDETGRFTLTGVPSGTYLTVAAGPVASVGGASASRPNAYVDAGRTADLGTLMLSSPAGAGCSYGGYSVAPGAEGFAEPSEPQLGPTPGN